MALKGKGSGPRVKTLGSKNRINDGTDTPSQNKSDNPYGGSAGDPTAYPGGHARMAKPKKNK